jgi:regulator of protease activity HflC (stomatin/prohibitin superfamily)
MQGIKRFVSLAAAVIGLALATGCTQIDTGNVGVAKTMGKYDPQERAPGVYFTPIESVSEFTTKEVAIAVNDLKPKAQDNLTMTDMDVDVYFKANPALISETVTKYQGDFARHDQLVQGGSSDLVVGVSRVSREAREAIYNAVAEFQATTMHTKRNELAASIQKKLQSELDKSDPGMWTITNVNVRNLVTDPGIEQAIRARAETDQAIARAQKEVELAKAQAETKRVQAEGEARANEIIAASLTGNLIRLREIEAQKAFAGQGTHTVLMGGGATPLIQAK